MYDIHGRSNVTEFQNKISIFTYLAYFFQVKTNILNISLLTLFLKAKKMWNLCRKCIKMPKIVLTLSNKKVNWFNARVAINANGQRWIVDKQPIQYSTCVRGGLCVVNSPPLPDPLGYWKLQVTTNLLLEFQKDTIFLSQIKTSNPRLKNLNAGADPGLILGPPHTNVHPHISSK